MRHSYQKGKAVSTIHVVITGSRDWPVEKAPVIWDALEEIAEAIGDGEEYEYGWRPHRIVFHHGECPFGGADLIGASWAAGRGWEVVPHPPLKREGWAYAKRNQEMIDLNPDYVLGCFLKGAANKGTQMTFDMAKDAGIEQRWSVVA